MAGVGRPRITNLSFFRHNTVHDDYTQGFINETGRAGYSFYFRISERIHFGNGYYYDLSGKGKEILMPYTFCETEDEFDSLLEVALDYGVFNKESYEKYNILTSKEIQEHYLIGNEKRTATPIIQEYSLIQDLITNNDRIEISSICGEESHIYGEESPFFDTNSPQRKENNTKEYNKKEDNKKTEIKENNITKEGEKKRGTGKDTQGKPNLLTPTVKAVGEEPADEDWFNKNAHKLR